MSEVDPIIGNWYQSPDIDQGFIVIAVEDHGELIEIQYFDGNLETIDIETWHKLGIEFTEAPENIRDLLDVGEIDNLATSITDTEAVGWMEPGQSFQTHGEDNAYDEDESGDDFPEEGLLESESQLSF